MQRLLSDFPPAPPGLGLLLLRTVLAIFLIADGTARTVGAFDASGGGAQELIQGLLLVLLGLAAWAGYLTPIVHTIIAVVELVSAVTGVQATTSTALPNAVWQIPLLLVVIALAVALLGPGAYSIDSRLFGRREITLRPPVRED